MRAASSWRIFRRSSWLRKITLSVRGAILQQAAPTIRADHPDTEMRRDLGPASEAANRTLFSLEGTGMKFPSLKHPALRPDDL